MNTNKAKNILSKYTGKTDICEIFMKQQGLPKLRVNTLWENYVEYMVIKALGCDIGAGDQMKFSASERVDDLWHCHVLCTERYQAFMRLVNQVNPLVDFLHHSLLLTLSSNKGKVKRREATATAYRKLFGKDCTWLNERPTQETPNPMKRKQQQGAKRDDVGLYDFDSSEDEEHYSLDEDAKEENDSEVSDSTDNYSDWSGGGKGDEEEGNDEEKERRREEKRKEKERKKAEKEVKKKVNRKRKASKATDEDGGSQSKKKKKDNDAPKRYMSAYVLFLNANRDKIKEENPSIKKTEIATKCAEMWKALEDKSEWEEKAKEEKAQYEKEMADYKEKLKERGEDMEETPETPKKRKSTRTSTSSKPKAKPKSTPSEVDNSKIKSAEYIKDDFSSVDDGGDDKKKKEKPKSKSESEDTDQEKKEKHEREEGHKKTESEEDEEDSEAEHDSDAEIEPSTRSTRSKRAEGDEEFKELDEKALENDYGEEAQFTDGPDGDGYKSEDDGDDDDDSDGD